MSRSLLWFILESLLIQPGDWMANRSCRIGIELHQSRPARSGDVGLHSTLRLGFGRSKTQPLHERLELAHGRSDMQMWDVG